jgi:hypothetical protein
VVARPDAVTGAAASVDVLLQVLVRDHRLTPKSLFFRLAN